MEMGMIAFYAGLLLGVLVGVVLTFLLSKLVIREECPALPGEGGGLAPVAAGPGELKTP
jgi:hypothetical protein